MEIRLAQSKLVRLWVELRKFRALHFSEFKNVYARCIRIDAFQDARLKVKYSEEDTVRKFKTIKMQ